MAILGLVTTESDSSWRFKNVRRQVFYFYPNGAAPLTGLLSMVKEEETNDPEFSWFEKRLIERATTTASQGSSKGPFTDTGGTDLGDPAAITAGTAIRVYVAALDLLKTGDVLRITCDNNDAAGTVEVRGVVILKSASTGAGYVHITPTSTHSSALSNRPKNGTTNENVSKVVTVAGTAYEQGASGPTTEQYNLPIEPINYCQIFRTPFSLTGTAAKTDVRFDTTGPYKDKAKEHSVNHMIEVENAFLFGSRTKIANHNSTGLPLFTTGGILWFLEEWEKPGASANIAYRGTSAAAVTLDTDDDKRIIQNTSGLLNEKSYDKYLERVFRVTNNTANEKLVFCGSGFLNVINQLYKSKACLDTSLPMKDTYGMSVVRHVCPFGTLYYKSHPLFSRSSQLRNAALILDIQNLRYRYIAGRDTELLKNRQNNGDDFRRDEWLTECGLELRFPEANMLLLNVLDYSP